MNRRRFLGGLAATACTRPRPPLVGAVEGTESFRRGHRLLAPLVRSEVVPDATDVVVVGAGVSGLSAAWRLRHAGFGGRITLLELEDTAGGTAVAGASAVTPYPWGAHYITVPNRDARHMHVLLRDLGVVEGFAADGAPVYDDDMFCLAPEERLYEAGEWTDGLWPLLHATPADRAARDAFLAETARWSAWTGSDGRPAFTIPVAGCSDDPEVRQLVNVSFAAWLDELGYTPPAFRWWVEYATRDDYGVSAEHVSAWAGLHYFASRRPWYSGARDLGTHVLTWPAGNGWLVERLRRAAVEFVPGAVVRAVEVGRVWFDLGETLRAVDTRFVILAVPGRVVDRLLGWTRVTPDAAPWLVAQLHVDRLPAARGLVSAWDSVVYGASSLGYVTSTHQRGDDRGPSVLTWYEPRPTSDRAALLGLGWEEGVARILADLAPAHPDLEAVLSRVDLRAWGHGTVIPAVGLHAAGGLAALAEAPEGMAFAHTDLSGLSLFEEASWHGVRAAERALVALGVPVERLAP